MESYDRRRFGREGQGVGVSGAQAMRLLDLCCGAGGAAMGYHRAGFTEIVGIDNRPQPRYPFRFIQADALKPPVRLEDFDAIHASPPCQAYSAMTKGRWQDREHADLVGAIRELIAASGRPWVIENVMGAPLRYSLQLCGTQFGLQTTEGSQFESPWVFALLPPCSHNDGSAIGVYGGGQHPSRRRPATIGVWGNSGGFSQRDSLHHYGIDKRKEAMQIDWMNGDELSEAIPPAYTEFIGRQLLAAIQ
jgi:DNA (cytosine-5)-methyltransferase 1